MKNYMFYILLVLIIINSFFLGYNINWFSELDELKIEGLTFNNSNCSNLDLFDSSICLNSQFNEFFKYNISQIGKDLTLEELKRDGGVCSHASKYYSDNAEDLGFYGTTCIMKVYKDLDNVTHQHEIAIMSNEEGYVVLDQKNIVGEGYFKINSSEVLNE